MNRVRAIAVVVALLIAASCRRQDGSREERESPEQRLSLQRVEGGAVASRTFRAMDTVYTLTVGHRGAWDAGAEGRALDAFSAAEAEVRRVESLMSSHRPSGDVHRLNASAREWVPVDPATLRVLLAAVRVGHATGGAFDVTWTALRPLYRLRDPDWRPPPRDALERARALVDFRAIELDVQGSRARFAKAGMAVDLGGIAKGHALDLAAEALARAGFPDHLVNGGGDLRVGGARPDRKWKMGIRAPRKGGIYKSGVIRSARFALVTSGDYERFRVVDGVRHSHILDPRTGESARGAVGVTVLGPEGMIADALATGLFVLGPQEGLKVLDHFPGYEALWLDESEDARASPGFWTAWEEP
jgi:FAD:protein FMN transferase